MDPEMAGGAVWLAVVPVNPGDRPGRLTPVRSEADVGRVQVAVPARKRDGAGPDFVAPATSARDVDGRPSKSRGPMRPDQKPEGQDREDGQRAH